MTDDRIAFRSVPADRTNLAIIAASLRANGQPFANRTDALRHALSTVANAISPPAPR